MKLIDVINQTFETKQSVEIKSNDIRIEIEYDMDDDSVDVDYEDIFDGEIVGGGGFTIAKDMDNSEIKSLLELNFPDHYDRNLADKK
jgi:hypothetical protein